VLEYQYIFSMNKAGLKKYALPHAPGIYIFKERVGKKEAIVYVGKATSLRDRVKSYFAKDVLSTRGGKVASMVLGATKLEWVETDSVLEALILEANYIKKYTPVGNTRDKDNKSFNYVVITDEDFPRVLVVRGREFFAGTSSAGNSEGVKHTFGPYPDGSSLREAVKLVRKIFPFRDTCAPRMTLERKEAKLPFEASCKPCFNRQIGLCPGVCDGSCSRKDYATLVRNIVLFFSGKKHQLVRTLSREMARASSDEDFEKAGRIKRQLTSLAHIRDVALMKRDNAISNGGNFAFRMEAYDVAHISGTHTVGVMVVSEGGTIAKAELRKFIIRTSTNDDLASLEELLTRRFSHPEWRMPSLVVVDGGEMQLACARRVFSQLRLQIPLVAVVKDDRHKARGLLGDDTMIAKYSREIMALNAEAHTKALAFHRARRDVVTR
jgi:excinuclease ABC subunit C